MTEPLPKPLLLLLDAAVFRGEVAPALAECGRRRSFAPGRALFAAVAEAARAFAARYHTGADEPLAASAARDLAFDRDRWRLLAGEALLYRAADIPELELAPDTLCRLLAPQRADPGRGPRSEWAPVEQVFYGSRDLVFGGAFYRPDHAGFNDLDDVVRLARYLETIDPLAWQAADLEGLDLIAPDDREEELDYVREWFPALRDLYRRAADRGWVVVSELL